jgi:hypothetical protein
MIYEWRTYEAMPGKLPALHTHLEVAASLFTKHESGRAGKELGGVLARPGLATGADGVGEEWPPGGEGLQPNPAADCLLAERVRFSCTPDSDSFFSQASDRTGGKAITSFLTS